jgi:hypothetical protein
MPDDSKRDYEVGYGRPPRHRRFRQGESGNPRGRPKGSSNLATLLDRALNERVVVSENGRRKRITKREAVLKQLVNKAASGDPKSIQLLLAEMRLVEGREAAPAESLLFDQTDREVIRHLYERLREGGKESNES